MKIVLTRRPYSCRARVSRFLRGYDWSLPISSDAVTQPRFSDPATRSRSSQWRRIRSRLIRPLSRGPRWG